MKNLSHGFSLIEVMVTAAILAIGLLGIAALQVTTSKYSASGLYRSQAAALSREIVERMRANPDAARAGFYDVNSLPSFSRDCSGISANCTAGQMREHDLRLWSTRVASILPSGDATIDTQPDPPNASAPSTITVTMRWDESQGERVDDFGAVIMVQQQFVFELFGLDT